MLVSLPTRGSVITSEDCAQIEKLDNARSSSPEAKRQINRLYTPVEALQLPVGALFAFNNNNSRAIGVVIQTGAVEGTVQIAVLCAGADKGTAPFHESIDKYDMVLPFGDDWILELKESDKCFPGNTSALNVPGVVTVSDQGAFMNLAPSPTIQGSYPIRILLPTCQPRRATGSYSKMDTPVTAWDVWLASDYQNRPVSSPICSFSY